MTSSIDTRIHSVYAREILDSRSNPTVEATVVLASGYRGTASVPSGASVGHYEALELRDSDQGRFHGKGVLKAITNITSVITPKLVGIDSRKQSDIDRIMLELDNTPNKSYLGANSILAVSMATAVAASNALQMPLYRYINFLVNGYLKIDLRRMPTPLFNIINGKKHGVPTIDFQEFHVIPASNYCFSDSLRIGSEVYIELGNVLESQGISKSVGDEGGYTPSGFTNNEAILAIHQAINQSHYRYGSDIYFGLDAAADEFYSAKGYQVHSLTKDDSNTLLDLSNKQMIEYYKEIHKTYQLLLLEDGLSDDDWIGWNILAEALGHEVYIVGDDLVATNPKRLEKAINERALNGVILKLNQIGTLSELLEVVKIAKSYGVKTIVAHRSGETTDTFIADLAVGIQSDYTKFGAPSRGERVSKYNRLWQIETEAFTKKT